ncbi:MAG: hypothetical protein KAI86_08695, partial [Desulfobacterales bacterium]|nr:hypothetical protein [Desulfobacterales bacterium]
MFGFNRGHSIIEYISTGGTIPRTAQSSYDLLVKTTIYALCVALVFVLLVGVGSAAKNNTAPVLDPISTVQINESETVTIVLVASDSDNNTITYSKNVTFGNLNWNIFTWATSYEDSGTYNIQFTVSDGTLTDAKIGIIEVGNTNRAPVLNPISMVQISENETATIILSSSDSDGNNVTYSKNVTFGSLSGNTFTWATSYGDSGTYSIQFTVSDGTLTDTEIGIIEVGNTNRAPVLAIIGSKSVDEDTELSFTVSA